MNFSIEQSILIEHLNYVIKGISTKNLIPILNCIKFELDKDGLYLMSTDNEMAIKTFIPKEKIEKIETLGEVVVSGRFIYEIIRKLPNEIVNLEEVANSKLFITTTNSSFNLNCNNIDEFPNLDLENAENPISIPKKSFRMLINQTAFATSTQESRPVLTGINFVINNNILECTATDSYRLSKRSISIEGNSEFTNIIVPTRNLLELIKIIDEDDENIELHIFTNKIIFKFDNIVFMTRLINGTYPDTSQLMPNNFALELEVNYNELFSAIDRASLMSSGDDKNTVSFESKENSILISSNIPEIGNVEEKISIVSKKGDDIRISFSSKYMIDAVRALSSDRIVMKFNGEIKPIILVSPDNNELNELIVPIRTY